LVVVLVVVVVVVVVRPVNIRFILRSDHCCGWGAVVGATGHWPVC
jgi:hypothetical protein